MDSVLYNAVNGGHTNFTRQEIIANNLANANTPGFRADLYQAQTMYVKGAEGARGFGQTFTVQSKNGVDLTPGDLMTTGRELDIAVDGNGWFAVSSGQGAESYTKAGSLRLDATGQLLTASGKSVIGNGGPISIPPAESVDIGTDGTISIVPLGSDTKIAVTIDRIKMVTLDKNNISKNADGLFQLNNGAIAPVDSTLTLRSGVLEGSNVHAVEQMVAMITAGRDFESHMNLMSTVGDNAQKLAQIIHE